MTNNINKKYIYSDIVFEKMESATLNIGLEIYEIL